jgi:FtsH-binding integral membrane protein
MSETLKKILLITCFGIIIWLVIIFMVSAGVIILVLTVIGLVIFGAYKLWEDYAKKELLKREENFDILKDSKKEEKE